jgi:hypothetical protein
MQIAEPADTDLKVKSQQKGKKAKRNGPLPTVEELTEVVGHILRAVDSYKLSEDKNADPKGIDLILGVCALVRADMAFRQKQWDRNSNITQTNQVTAIYKDFTDGICTKEEAEEEIWEIYKMRRVPEEKKADILACLSPSKDEIQVNGGPKRTAALNVGVAQLHLRGEARTDSSFFSDSRIMSELRLSSVPFGKYAGPDIESRMLEFLIVDVMKYDRSETVEPIEAIVASRLGPFS